MTFKNFSQKQLKALSWWADTSPWKDHDAIICDGAVRSGKTLCLSMSFILWAMNAFTDKNLAICGKTVLSCRRNVITPLIPILKDVFKYKATLKFTEGVLEVESAKAKNRFYIFGGKDEGSAALIQGVTLAGILFDEVALMPQSFVEQGLARCSVEGSKYWFNCNPEHPSHWFYTEWIEKRERKNACYLHFTMEDNPSLSEKMLTRYKSLYSGIFYERYVLGRWVVAHGIVYPMFSKDRHIVQDIPDGPGRYYLSIDYGTVNAFAAGLWTITGGKSYKVREYYHDARKEGQRKTDEEYYSDVDVLVGDAPLEYIVIDPSAASFIECVRRHGRYRVRKARNDVINGIRTVSSLLQTDRIFYHASCRDTINEFALYRWDDKAKGDVPLKENDHAMDSDRYYAYTVLCDEFGLMSWSKGR